MFELQDDEVIIEEDAMIEDERPEEEMGVEEATTDEELLVLFTPAGGTWDHLGTFARAATLVRRTARTVIVSCMFPIAWLKVLE